MKKLGFLVMSLMAVSLLASCGGGNTPSDDVKFTADTTVTLDASKKVANIQLDWTPSEHSIECSGFTFTLNNQSSITSTIVPGELGSRPLNLTITFASALSTDDKGYLKFHYNDKTAKKEGEGKVEGINVKLPIDPPGPTAWYLDNDYLNSLTPGDVTKENPDGSVGVVQTLKVNGLDHKVRLIGVDKDKTASGSTLHTTWEFANLISDANGYSLATQWNDTNEIDTANHKYKESTIRNALNGEKVSNVRWAQKEQTTWSSDYKCSVLDMLNAENEGFGDALKAPRNI